MKLLYVNDKNAKLFEKEAKKKDTFVKYFSPSCPACIAMEDEWDDLCKDIDEKYNTDLILAQMDPSGMKELESSEVHTDVEFVPTMIVLKNGKKHKEYNGAKKKEDMINFLVKEGYIHPKMKGGGKTLKNNKNKKCSGNNFTNCCPHMAVNAKGEYTATTKSRPHILHLDGNKYRFYTCCMACKEAMSKMARENPKKFKAIYVKTIKGDKIYFKHRDTGKLVQIGRKIKSKTKKIGGSDRSDSLVSNISRDYRSTPQRGFKQDINFEENRLWLVPLLASVNKMKKNGNLNDVIEYATKNVDRVFRDNTIIGSNYDEYNHIWKYCASFPSNLEICRKSKGFGNLSVPKQRKYNPEYSDNLFKQKDLDLAYESYLFLEYVDNIKEVLKTPRSDYTRISREFLEKVRTYEDKGDKSQISVLLKAYDYQEPVQVNESKFPELRELMRRAQESQNAVLRDPKVQKEMVTQGLVGGKKRSKKSKRSKRHCIGKRDGKKGCRTCCKKNRKYKKCITRCMKGN